MHQQFRVVPRLLAAAALCFGAVGASAQVVVFEENFSNGLGQFTGSGVASQAGGAAYLNGCFGCTPGAIVSAPIDTRGFTALKLSYDRTVSGLDFGEYGAVGYSVDGSTWKAVEYLTSGSGRVSFSLPDEAAGQAALRLRFRVAASLPAEYLKVDNVVLEGTAQPPAPGGSGYQKGPEPTAALLEAGTGPFATASVTLSRSAASGFGGGTIHYPQGVAGPFAAVAVVPGYLAAESTIAWWGPRLASHGFVVITMATNSTYDLPASRSTQLTAALNQLKALSATPGHAVFGLVDPNRLGVVGWSYGGGGTLLNAQANPQLKAAMALAPKTLQQGDFTGTTVPTLVVGCQADTTAAPAFWAIPFYNKVSASTGKAYLEVRGGSHFCVTSATSDADKKALGKYGVAWLKRFMDEDTRYAPFLCGAPRQADVAGNAAISDYRDNCPY